MTVLKQYERLEASALYRPAPGEQRREVIVSLGEATLMISDTRGTALTHWSLPALECLRPAGAEEGALYRPAPDAGETLEIDDPVMIAALDRVKAALDRARPHPGRLRQVLIGATVVALLALAIFWLPGALISRTAGIVPFAKRAEIGRELAADMRPVTGAPCDGAAGRRALARMKQRLMGVGPTEIQVLPAGVPGSTHLPGRLILLDKALVEGEDDPAVIAGYILREAEAAARADPLEALLHHAGFFATLRLLTTGELPEGALRRYADTLLTRPAPALPDEALLARFERAELPATPYAYAVDPTGESTLALIEADPVADGGRPVLSDGEWVALQNICNG